jgi:hypothetical protein
MPLQASHIKFALDQLTYFKPEDLGKYLSGAVYPDSRYLSGMDRSVTHSQDFWLEGFWRGDDFRKGWASHNISDRAYTRGIRKIFPLWTDFKDDWVKVENAAVKILGDIFLLKGLKIAEKFASIKAIPSPNNESEEKMKEHLEVMKACYKNGDEAKIADYYEVVEKSFGKEMAEKVIAKAEELAADEQLISKIEDYFVNGVGREVANIFKEMEKVI